MNSIFELLFLHKKLIIFLMASKKQEKLLMQTIPAYTKRINF